MGAVILEDMADSGVDTVILVSRWYETKDPDLFDPNICWEVLSAFPEGGSYMGRDVVIKEFFPKLISHFTSLIAIPLEHYCNNSGVVTVGRYEGKIGEELFVAEFAHVWRATAGKLSFFKQITDTAAIEKIRGQMGRDHC